MSNAVYPVLLRYIDDAGCAKIPGVERRFTHPPHIYGIPSFATIDYAPAPSEDHPTVARIMPVQSEQDREMTEGEMRAADRWLAGLRRCKIPNCEVELWLQNQTG